MRPLHSFQVVVAFLYQNEFYMGNSQLSLDQILFNPSP